MDSEIIIHLFDDAVFPTEDDLYCESSSYSKRTPNFFVLYRYNVIKRSWIFAEAVPVYDPDGSIVRYPRPRHA